LLLCLGKHTLTGLIITAGRQFCDWSQDYRLFAEERLQMGKLFDLLRRNLVARLGPDDPLIVAMDDTKLRKTGHKIPGAKYHRDPLSPKFRPNFMWGLRWIQLSGLLSPKGEGPARGIPLTFQHAPLPSKPKKKASDEEWKEYHHQREEANLSKVGVGLINNLRQSMNQEHGQANRPLWMLTDGSYTNQKVLRNLPPGTTLIGRIRKDSAFHFPVNPLDRKVRGRKLQYGKPAPTPEALRQDEAVPWQHVDIFAAGKTHQTDIKVMGPVLSRVAGPNLPLMVIVIRPLAYRLSPGSKRLYREPAYLICTDPSLPVREVLQAYFRRWEIEVNFRDEKQLIGLGEAQVRSRHSVDTWPAFAAATYGMLLLAGAEAYGLNGAPASLPPPRWQKKGKPRASTHDLIKELRWEMWGEVLDPGNFSGFVEQEGGDSKPEKFARTVGMAVINA
jgi:hypothetical protein